MQIGRWNIQYFTRNSTSGKGYMVADGRNFTGALRNSTNSGRRRRVNLSHREYDFKEGGVKIEVYNMHRVFIDFELEEDHRNIYGKSFLPICGMQMKLLKWTKDFKLEKETTLAAVWVNLPELPWHYYEWDALCRILALIGTPIITDKATLSNTRPTTTKVKVEIDVTKQTLNEVLHPELRTERKKQGRDRKCGIDDPNSSNDKVKDDTSVKAMQIDKTKVCETNAGERVSTTMDSEKKQVGEGWATVREKRAQQRQNFNKKEATK
ncbi:hypothetical protein FXO38_05910 [Capsicum annuum]|nr:hypothetical protein FXO37_17211 [Capsicum annuum]KAF3672863.1 hypothetical protein FXO38_05910 [Capsicum annuum]